jgi:hypothetical protein
MKLDKLLIIPYTSYSNYVNLPSNILDKLSKNNCNQYFFELKTSYGLSFYVGVKQFTAIDNTIEVPEWIANNIGEDYIEVHLLKNIQKGKYVKIQPQEKKFFNLPENDILLEKALSEYCLLNNNQTIKVNLLDEEYSMKIMEIKTENNKNAKTINIVNVDLNVDFDNKFPEEKKPEEKSINMPVFKDVSEDLMVPTNLNSKIEPVGNMLNNNPIQTYTQEEIRKMRLAYFKNKFAEQEKLKNIEKSLDEKHTTENNKKEMEI